MNHLHPFELAVPVTAADHVLGGAHAPATLAEYGDFECPNCKQSARAVRRLPEKHAGRLPAEFGHFPREEVYPPAFGAALAAVAAGAQGKIGGANRGGVRATPTFFRSGKLCDVSSGLKHLAQAVESVMRR